MKFMKKGTLIENLVCLVKIILKKEAVIGASIFFFHIGSTLLLLVGLLGNAIA